jgi:hypothetical protein
LRGDEGPALGAGGHRRGQRVPERSADVDAVARPRRRARVRSIYAWGFLLLFAGVAVSDRRSANRTVQPRPPSATNVASPP